MARLVGVSIDKLEGGLARLATGTDSHVAYITSIADAAIATAVNNGGKGVVITAVYEAELLGIDEKYDTDHNSKLYDGIVDFFRIAPEATLYLFSSTITADVVSFINQNKEIKGYGLNVTYNTDTPNVAGVVAAHQVIVNDLASENRLIDFVMVGFDQLNDFSIDLFELQAPQVSVCIACEDASGKVSVLTALAGLAVRKVSENLGSVDIERKPRTKRGRLDYTLTDTLLSRWINAYLPNGQSVEAINKATLNSIINKGYILVASYEGYAGFFFENSYTCTDRSSDYAYIENNRVWNKSARIIRSTLLPRVKSKVKKDPTTGFIASTTVGYWEGLLNTALEQLIADDDISGFDVSISTQQVVNSASPVKVQALIVADGIVHEFEVAIGLTNNI